MNIVVDTNIVIAAILRDGVCRRLIFRGTFFAPEYLLDELEAHQKEFVEKSGLPPEEFLQIRDLILSQLTFVDYDALHQHIPVAEALMKKIDPYDSPFIACALATGSILWSDDTKLKKQDAVVVKNTAEMMRLSRP